jgi:hypothetical protein
MARIDHYGFGRIVVDGGEETNDLILLPDRVVLELVAPGRPRAVARRPGRDPRRSPFPPGRRHGCRRLEMWIADPDGVRICIVEVPADHPLRRRN